MLVWKWPSHAKRVRKTYTIQITIQYHLAFEGWQWGKLTQLCAATTFFWCLIINKKKCDFIVWIEKERQYGRFWPSVKMYYLFAFQHFFKFPLNTGYRHIRHFVTQHKNGTKHWSKTQAANARNNKSSYLSRIIKLLIQWKHKISAVQLYNQEMRQFFCIAFRRGD